MRQKLDAVLEILDFFIPFEVLSGVGLVFAAENIADAYITTGTVPMVWIKVYVVFIVFIGIGRYASASSDEREELSDELDELVD